ncbi:hypothetical protein ABZY06_33895 [Streptomyces sp. NPDC006540]|uniref:hypothetical protein n=1 Tax=Streptomyces sp. NPDC006540 TaxID=3155353 RepID=UPI0033A65A43
MTEPNDPLGVVIGTREIYDTLVSVRDDVRSLVQDREDIDADITELKKEVRELQRFRHAYPLTALGVIITSVTALLKSTGTV